MSDANLPADIQRAVERSPLAQAFRFVGRPVTFRFPAAGVDLDHDLRIDQIEDRIHVARRERLIAAAREGDVFLRHHLSSIAV